MKNLRLIKLNIDKKIDMKLTSFYKWLEQQKPKDINLETKINYLKEVHGFVIGETKISESDLQSLNYIQDYYFEYEIKPKLPKLIFEEN